MALSCSRPAADRAGVPADRAGVPAGVISGLRSPTAMAMMVIWTVTATATAAEIHLRRECRCAGALVTLNDVAEIYANSAAEGSRLAAVELFPAPTAGKSRMVRSREIQDLLGRRGVDLRKNRLAGASTVTVFGRQQTPADPSRSAATFRHRLETRLADYLRQEVDHDVAWQVSVESTPDFAGTNREQLQIVNVAGGRAPWVGAQRFAVTLSDGHARREASVAAQVTRPVGVVVPVRPLARGQVVQASDVQIQTAPGGGKDGRAVSNLDHAVGYEVTRPVPAGRPLEAGDLRPPVLVTRNSVVTVFARTRGIQVRTSAKALEEGSRNDLIKVQSLLDREEEFLARVVGHKEVEVFAGSPRIESPRTQSPRTESPRTQSPRTESPRTESPRTESPRTESAGRQRRGPQNMKDKTGLDSAQRPSMFGLRVQGALAPALQD